MPDAVGDAQHGDDQRLVVGGDAGVRQRGDVDRAQPLGRRRPPGRRSDASIARPMSRKRVSSISMCAGRAPRDDDLAAGHGDRGEVGGGLDPVGHRACARRVAASRARRRVTVSVDGADAVDVGAHRDEEVAQVDDLGLAGRVVDRRGPLGVHRRHQHVLGGADAREVERDVGAVQAIGERLEVAVAELERRAHRLEPGHVHVDRPGAEVVAAGQRQPHVPAPGEQRTEHVDRGPDPLDELVRRDGREVAAVGEDAAGRVRARRSTRRSPPSRSPMIATSTIVGDVASARTSRRPAASPPSA